MKLWTKALLAIGGLVMLGGAASTASADDSDDDDDDDDGGASVPSKKQRVYWRLRQISTLSEMQRLTIMLIAYGEGGYSPTAHNGSPMERDASAKAAANNPTIVQRAYACGVDADVFKTGSWTMFQFLAPYASHTAYEVFGGAYCPFADPTKMAGTTWAHIDLQIVLAIEHARDLQGYDSWRVNPANRTVGNLRLGWAAPGLMGDDWATRQKTRIDKYRAQAAKEGFPGIVDSLVEVFPNNPAQIYADLRNTPPPDKDPLA